MNRQRFFSARAATCALVAMCWLGAGPRVLAQNQADQPSANPKLKAASQQRKSPVNLDAQAKERRPGQVMPGDPSPNGAAAAKPSAAQPSNSDVELPDTSPEHKPSPMLPGPSDAAGRSSAGAETGERSAALDRGILGSLTPAAGLGPASVRVAQVSGGLAEWHSQGGTWAAVTAGQTAESRVEVRGGVDCDVLLVVDDAVEVRLGRLARIVIERAAEGDGTISTSLALVRGLADVRPVPGAKADGRASWLARVRTPDREFALNAPARVEYDAFSGTRVRLSATVGR